MGEDLQHTFIYFNNVERQSLLGVLLILFIVVVFLGFIFIRFLYRQRSLLRDLPTTMVRTNNNGELLPCASLGLDVDKINSLPMFTHKLSDNSDDGSSSSRRSSSSSIAFSFMESECCICLGTFEDEEILKLMPECLHVFHSECVDKWLSSSSTCPLCRSPI